MTSQHATDADCLELRLPFARPLDWPALLAFLAARAIPGVEAVRAGSYRRSLPMDDGEAGTVEISARSGKAGCLIARLRLPRQTAPAPIAARLRRLFDLDAGPTVIAAHLSRDPLLRPHVAARPGLRVPGAWDPFELAVRAMLGQQVSVAGATTLSGRLVARYGETLPPALADPDLTSLFPPARVLAAADLRGIGLPAARAASIAALAAAFAADPGVLRAQGDLDATIRHLVILPGIGPWTAQYIAMRALRQPDAFPASDLGLLRAAAGADGVRPSPAALLRRAEAWRPWRAYAAMQLWASSGRRSPAQRRPA